MIKITKTLTFDSCLFNVHTEVIAYFAYMQIIKTVVKRILFTVVIYYYVTVIHDYFQSHTSIKKMG